MKSKRAIQGELEFPKWGGARKGAGRKCRDARPCESRRARPEHKRRFPLHVTLKLAEGLPSLRRPDTHRLLRAALIAGASREDFRLVHYVAMGNHMHLVCEADERRSLSRGIQGVCVRIARALNRAWRRKGRVFLDRFHARALQSPREVRNVLVYVLHNARRHRLVLESELDPFSSARWFDGWSGAMRKSSACQELSPLAGATAWLLTSGWRRHGLLARCDLPAPPVVHEESTRPARNRVLRSRP